LAASASVTAQIDQLIDLFNRRSLDLPAGLFTRQTQFVLNGIPFEARLGRSPADPLVLMLARGAAGYRFAAKAVQHAIPDARLQRGELRETHDDTQRTVHGQCWLSGHLRGTGEPVEMLVAMALRLQGPALVQMAAAMDEQALATLQAARLRI
jgi:hypothetical protein